MPDDDEETTPNPSWQVKQLAADYKYLRDAVQIDDKALATGLAFDLMALIYPKIAH